MILQLLTLTLLILTSLRFMISNTYHHLFDGDIYLYCPPWHWEFEVRMASLWMAWARRAMDTLGA